MASWGRKIELMSSDGKEFMVEEAVALESETLKHVIEDVYVKGDVIPLPNVTSKTLSKVIEYCKKHVEANSSTSDDADLKNWDAGFVNVDQSTLIDLFKAANYLNIKGLLDLTHQTVTDVTSLVHLENPLAFGMVVLKSSDGKEFMVKDVVALESQVIKHMIEDDCAYSCIPLPNITSEILSKVIEYCEKHVKAKSSSSSSCFSTSDDADLRNWDVSFAKVDLPTLFDLILAANYLNIKGLLDLTCQTVADMIKGRTPEEIRKIFNLKDLTPDLTPEEEEEVRRENQWAFE